jgi:hypothetical protein
VSARHEFELTPDQILREQAVLANFSHLIETERSRYENQAIQLLEKGQFESEIDGFKLSYMVKPNTYLCRLQNHDISGDSYEIEFPIPESKEEMLETLVELFAQSEAKCLIGAH